MKIYTRKGDSGTTQLIGGTRVSKNHIRIESYGTVDELNSWLGMVECKLNRESLKSTIRIIQDRLFTIGSLLAMDPATSAMKLPGISEEDVLLLEQEIDVMNETLPELRAFILPGGNPANATCHLARCVCRRAERCVVHLNEQERVDPLILKYLNRLSDYLFVLARKVTGDEGKEDMVWKPRQ